MTKRKEESHMVAVYHQFVYEIVELEDKKTRNKYIKLVAANLAKDVQVALDWPEDIIDDFEASNAYAEKNRSALDKWWDGK